MSAPRRRHAARRLIGVALLALLFGQWAALAHSIGHAHLPSQAALHDHDHDHDHDDGRDHDPWGHEAGTSGCQLFDHLLVEQAASGESQPALWRPAAYALPMALAPSISPCSPSRSYDARGPPRA